MTLPRAGGDVDRAKGDNQSHCDGCRVGGRQPFGSMKVTFGVTSIWIMTST